MRHERPVLLHGVTGSGKTEIYLQMIADVLEMGKQAVVLVPEIALTPLILERFLSRFGEKVSVTHSRLSTGERVDQWKRARDGEISVIIGPRFLLVKTLPFGYTVFPAVHAAFPPAAVPAAHLWKAVFSAGMRLPVRTGIRRKGTGNCPLSGKKRADYAAAEFTPKRL